MVQINSLLAPLVDIGVSAPLETRAAQLSAEYAGRSALELMEASVHHLYAGRIAVVSSFGAESAVLLHLLAQVDRSVPVLFVDTDKLFGETLRYRDTLVTRFGLTDVRTLTPDPARIAELDPKGGLWARSTDLCCQIRKVEPLARGLEGVRGIAGFDAWISGRKRFQATSRSSIPLFEADGARIKVNPLANWGPLDLQAYADLHVLPPHPLVAQGYPSIGCMPCTDPVAPGEDARAGRWRGQDKTECGIHIGDRIAADETSGSGI
jgi:phosphoadenosine phosphosulfate reductase